MILTNKNLTNAKISCILKITDLNNEFKFVKLCASLHYGVYIEYGIDEFGKVICHEVTSYNKLNDLILHWEQEYGNHRVTKYTISRGDLI